ncbi:hypothetical protein OIO90_006177 [Microbotryomycetes sp. JL221]|nr:hypothetical protein OIO90_006177 [Microbotryomycetes sp. JL221]
MSFHQPNESINNPAATHNPFFVCNNGSEPSLQSTAPPGSVKRCTVDVASACVGGILSGGSLLAGANGTLLSTPSAPAPYQVPVFVAGAIVGGASAIKAFCSLP